MMQRRKSLADGELHDCTILMEDGLFGFTFMFAPASYGEELAARLQSYCMMKKYQMKIDRWYGLGCFADVQGWTHAGIPIEEPWTYDKELEALVADAFVGSPSRIIDLRRLRMEKDT